MMPFRRIEAKNRKMLPRGVKPTETRTLSRHVTGDQPVLEGAAGLECRQTKTDQTGRNMTAMAAKKLYPPFQDDTDVDPGLD